jgi:hypothetical protein
MARMDENPYRAPAAINTPTVSLGEVWLALVPFVVAVPASLATAFLWYWRPFSDSENSAAIGVLGAILVFDLTICAWVLVHWLRDGKLPDMSLTPLFPSRKEREFRRALRQRPKLNDDEFYEAFYASSGIARHLPIQLRKSLEREFGVNFGALRPADNLIYACEEVDFADVRDRIKLDFGVDLTFEIAAVLSDEQSCTFDSLLQFVVNAQHEQPAAVSDSDANTRV